ncbi:hypothetical protein HK405_006817 [Cladochytrium tenue]|nr:hypothetical protein HK405_006817 [Cladochytrium tenue]
MPDTANPAGGPPFPMGHGYQQPHYASSAQQQQFQYGFAAPQQGYQAFRYNQTYVQYQPTITAAAGVAQPQYPAGPATGYAVPPQPQPPPPPPPAGPPPHISSGVSSPISAYGGAMPPMAYAGSPVVVQSPPSRQANAIPIPPRNTVAKGLGPRGSVAAGSLAEYRSGSQGGAGSSRAAVGGLDRSVSIRTFESRSSTGSSGGTPYAYMPAAESSVPPLPNAAAGGSRFDSGDAGNVRLEETASNSSSNQRSGSSGGVSSVPGSTGTTTTAGNTPVAPTRRQTRKSVDELLDLGASLFAPPKQDFRGALAKWDFAYFQAVKDDDHFGQARALSNMGCAYRAMCSFEKSIEFLKRSWKATLKYCTDQQQQAATFESVHWFEIVSRTLDFDNPDTYTNELEHYGDDLSSPLAAVDLAARPISRSKSGGSFSAVTPGPVPSLEPFAGPPIVIWFMTLTSNIGNAYFSLGKFEHAINWHAKCLALAETVLEEKPLPADFDKSAYDAMVSNARGRTVVVNKNFGATGQRVKLSFLHQSTILAQARSLSHIGICCQHLGLDDNALQTHSHASSILAFYAARSPSFSASSSTRVAKGKGRQEDTAEPGDVFAWQATLMDSYQASISANLAAAYHAKGRLPAAVERLERAQTQFKKATHAVGIAATAACLGAMHIEVGRVLGSLHWIRNMELQAVGAGEVNECMRYWGPPRLKGVNSGSGEWDESASVSAGSVWASQGIKVMLLQLPILKQKDDLFGVLTCLMNIASGYVIEKHPYMALHYIGRVLTEQTSSTRSFRIQSRTIPQFLRLQSYFTLCQAVFLLNRLQSDPEQPLYPGPYPDESDGFPFFDPIPIANVLKDLEMGYVSVDFPELDLLIAGFLAELESLSVTRVNVQSGLSYSILYSYLGRFAATDNPTVRAGPVTMGRDVGFGGTTVQAATMGVGTGMDLIRQKAALVSSLGGKADWMLGARYDLLFNERRARDFYTQGTGKMDSAAKETIKALVTGGAGNAAQSSGTLARGTTLSADIGVSGRASTDPALTSPEAGLVSAFFSLTGAAFAVPSVNPSAPPSYHHSLPLYSPVVTPALRATAFAAPALFALAADTMAFAAYQLQARVGAVGAATGYGGSASAAAVAAAAAASGLDLLRVLRIPLQPAPAKVHRELLSAAAAMYSAALGWCETCMRECLREPDVRVDVVFVGRDGNVGMAVLPEGGGGGGSGGDSSLGSSSSEASALAQLKFPCEHYYWRG